MAVFAFYLRACSPVEVDVTLLSIADRLATRGDRARGRDRRPSGGRTGRCSPTRCAGARRGAGQPLLRGDELGSHLGIAPGSASGTLLEELAEAQYAGDVTTREQALAYAHEARAAGPLSTIPIGSAQMRDPECIFCKIVAGELPATIVGADERTISFMDIAPATRGHALVIPREHSPDLLGHRRRGPGRRQPLPPRD